MLVDDIVLMNACWLIIMFACNSQEASLESPVVQPFYIPRSLRFGDRLQVTCTTVRGDTPLNFQWSHNGQSITNSGRATAKPFDQFSSVLIVPSIAASDIGNYTCTVSNAAGSDSNTARLQVEAPPEWVIEPTDMVVVLGSQATFNCKVVGFPEPKIIWLRDRGSGNGDFHVIRSDTRRTLLGNGSLIVLRAASGDNGYYRCDAKNGIGPTLSKVVKLTVRAPPKLIEGYQMITVSRGENAVFKCTAIGDQPLTATWSNDRGQLVSDVLGHRYVIKQKTTVDGIVSEVSIPRVTKEDAGLFTCKISNDVGQDEGKVNVEILEPPGPPVSVSASETSSRSARISWRPPETPSPSHVTAYFVRYWKNSGGSKKLQEMRIPGEAETNVYLADLKPGVTYTVNIIAENIVGTSEASKSTRFRTLDEVPSGPPTDVTAEAIGSAAVSVTWKAPPVDLCNGLLKGYYVGYKVFGSPGPYIYQTTTTSIGNIESLLITGLRLNTKYGIQVKAFNTAGSGPGSQETFVRTKLGNPPMPPSIALAEISHLSAKIRWNQIYIPPAKITHYLLQFKPESGSWQNLHIPGNKHEFLLRPLNSNHRYLIRLAAYNKFGKGNFSLPLTISTDPDPQPGVKGPFTAPPLYTQPKIVVSITAALVVIATAIAITWVCYKRNIANQDRRSVLPQIPDHNRASMAQSEGGYCDISRLPLYLHPHGHVTLSGTLRRRTEDMYDLPWDATMQAGTIDRTSGSYTRLKSGHNQRASVASCSNR